MPECHCDDIAEFHRSDGPAVMSDAGAMVYSELDSLMAEDLAFHEVQGDGNE